MGNFIKKIKKNDSKQNRVIELNGRNLIIVGNNGAGKTKFLNSLHVYLNNVFDNNSPTLDNLKTSFLDQEKYLKTLKAEDYTYQDNVNAVEHYRELINQRLFFDVEFNSPNLFFNAVKAKKLITRFFPANRQYKSVGFNLLTSIDALFVEFKNNSSSHSTTSDYFERYLVSMSNYALIEKGAGNVDEYSRVFNIISNIESDLKELFEDSSLHLFYNRKKLRMEIVQEGKEPSEFNTLPSGFSSVLAIYAELIMLVELSGGVKNSIGGIVLIDEIDAHLHVTVQKKVFNFFSTSFPDIQFVITTHSPFVVQSVSNALIYNLSTDEQMEDLSSYSYTSIIKGLLGETSNSADLEGILIELELLSKNNDFGIRFIEINNLLDSKYSFLDARAKTIVMSARARRIDWEEAQGDV